ncbi:MAG: ferritin [Saprospiraceae bacterium]|nr:ferritin [Saprospiraceae bacterium]
MLEKSIETALNAQLEKEAFASYSYLAMAAWCDQQSLDGCAQFFYRQSDEERMHMMKILHYLIERNGEITIPALQKPESGFKNIQEVFQMTFKQEQSVTQSINELINIAQKVQDHSTQNFLQWYVTEQREEEATIMKILDRIKLIGEGALSLYYIDQEVEKINKQIMAEEGGADA